MDLAAFLAPGVHPVYRVGNPSEDGPWGHLLCRPDGRVSWVAREPAPTGDRLVLTLKVPGYRLDVDGALAEAMGPGPDPGAWVVLTGEVRGCRLFQDRHYLLRLAGLVRILDP